MIKELIEDLVYDKISLQQAFMRSKLIAYKLNDNTFKNWINLELNGYSVDELPDYRIISCNLKAHITNGYGEELELPFIINKVNEQLGGRLYKIHVLQSLSILEESVKSSNNQYRQLMMHSGLVTTLRKLTYEALNGSYLREVGQEIQVSQLQYILDFTKQKLLDTLLDLNAAFPNMENEFKMSKEEIEKAQNIINTNIYGGANSPVNLGIGDNINQTNKVKFNQNFERLDELKNFGVDDQSLAEIKDILRDKADPEKEKTIAKRVMIWMGNLTTKAFEKGIELQVPMIMERVQEFL